MEPKTISVKFDKGALPEWPRQQPETVELAEANLAFRCDVCSAERPDYRRFLTRQARRIAEARANR